MKTFHNFSRLLAGATGFFRLALVGCSKDDDNFEPAPDDAFSGTELAAQLAAIDPEPLSLDEAQGLAFMREEEKLARDVYTLLYAEWNIKAFNNISSSEQTHMDAVLALLNRYELEDPAAGKAPGVFSNNDLQTLYDQLSAQGLENEIAGLTVGALIEETDIQDIQDQIDQYVDNQDIELIYENLMRGSRNHLRAFVSQLENRGVTYQPQILEMTRYLEIINSDMEHGHG